MHYSTRISKWQDFIDIIEKSSMKFPNVVSNEQIFRGQSNKNWALENSLFRLVKGVEKSETKIKLYELQSQMIFQSQVHLLDPTLLPSSPTNLISLLIDMQHYSCPTRLIDWSESPFIALYFCVNENFQEDGLFFAWNTLLYENKMRRLHDKFDKLNVSIKFDEVDFDYIQPIVPMKKNERIIRQQGIFSLSNSLLKNHCDLIDEPFSPSEKSGLIKIEIPKELKLEFLARLKMMNISAEILFPGLDGLGKSISEMLLIRKWTNV